MDREKGEERQRQRYGGVREVHKHHDGEKKTEKGERAETWVAWRGMSESMRGTWSQSRGQPDLPASCRATHDASNFWALGEKESSENSTEIKLPGMIGAVSRRHGCVATTAAQLGIAARMVRGTNNDAMKVATIDF